MKTPATLAQTIPAAITARLTAAIGIDPRALDPGRLKWIVGARCRHLKLSDANAYAAHLEASPGEIDALIDLVVVPETRFFRDPTVFDHIRSSVGQLAAKFPGPLRILSAPCGTGQEAYSLAALLTLAGLPLARFSIDAFDISLSALDIARRGIYPEHALSHVAPELQQACGASQHKHWQIHDELRQRINFERRNLAEPAALGTGPQYHLILCRNLFIYLRAEARTALAESLAAALVPGGRLVLGTADRVEELNGLFSPQRPAASFAFLHRTSALPAAQPARRRSSSTPGLAWGFSPTNKPHKPKGASAPAPSSGPVENGSTAADLLKRALEHRQHGELAKAERRCRQSLYLAPAYLPALELLQSLWDQNPNLRHRRALRDRILRTRLAIPVEVLAADPERKETA